MMTIVVSHPEDPGGAEGGAILLDTARREPIDGVIVGDQ